MNLSSMMDMDVTRHHKETAYVALQVAKALGFTDGPLSEIVFAAGIHDIGLFANAELKKYMDEDIETKLSVPFHAFAGYYVLKDFRYFRRIARIVKYHHLPYSRKDEVGEKVDFGAFVVALGDRFSVWFSRSDPFSVDARKRLVERIRENAGSYFHPRVVEAFLDVSSREAFWYELLVPYLDVIIVENLEPIDWKMNLNAIKELSVVFRRLIDFRSVFTATHSAGVSAVAYELGKLIGWRGKRLAKLGIAGNLHDFGKIVIPSEILEKRGKLNEKEYEIIKSHAYFTYTFLQTAGFDSDLVEWASYHHERNDGKGYPFKVRVSEKSEGARLMAVADVFTALTEERPYRKPMQLEEVLRLLHHSAEEGGLDPEMVYLLSKEADYINDVRASAQAKAATVFESLSSAARREVRGRANGN